MSRRHSGSWKAKSSLPIMQLIDTAGDGFFFHFRLAKDAFRFAEALQQITAAHNAQVTDEIAEHWFRTGAATGDVAWDEGKPVGHVVNVGSRLQSASTGGDFVIDQATYDDLPPDIQQQFGPKESIRDKHDKTYDVYRTAFGRVLPPLPISNPSNSTTPVFASTPASDSQPIKIVPKGLRSFDAHDADFFLELLPGLVTGTACPTAFASGRPASKRRTPTTPSPWA